MSEDMRLPEGYSCQDCFAFKRFCHPLGIAKPENKTCDYYPVRFRLSSERLAEFAKLRESETNV